MKNSLGTFEYESKAKWSNLIAACCFLMMLMMPTVGYAYMAIAPTNAVAGGGGGLGVTAIVTGTNQSSHRVSPNPVTWRNTPIRRCGLCTLSRTGILTACDRCRIGGKARGTNSHARNDMNVRIQGGRGDTPLFGAPTVRVQPGRTENTGVLLGSQSGTAHWWRAEIHNVRNGHGQILPWSGTAGVFRTQ